MRLTAPFVIAGLAMVAMPAVAQDDGHRVGLREAIRALGPGAYQGRNAGPEQTERFSRKVRIGRDGRFSLANIAGDIVVTGGQGDEVSIEAVKRTRGNKSELARVQITVDDRAGRVDVRTDGEQNRTDRNRRTDHVSVDYTVTVPASASVDVHSVSGSVKVTGVHGALRAETISGDVTTSDTPQLEQAKTVSGDMAVAYLPDNEAIEIEMSSFPTPIGVRWFDPVKGRYISVPGEIPNQGTHRFVPPSEGDWVLLLQGTGK